MARRLLAAAICGVLMLGFFACGRVGEVREVTLAPAPLEASAVRPLRAPWLLKVQEDPPLQLFTAADAVVPAVAIYDQPGAAVPSGELANPNREGQLLVMLVIENRGDWLLVQIPARPNGTTRWIRAGDVSLRMIATHLVVELGARRITALDAEDNPLLQEPVAVGQDRWPTPLGHFYLDSIFVSPGGAYGAYMLSVAAYSDVLTTFGGGVGQIAIHGTNQPGLIGQNVSHGCVRMTNEAITRLAAIAPAGTPVTILP